MEDVSDKVKEQQDYEREQYIKNEFERIYYPE